jgi:hypothetical protein
MTLVIGECDCPKEIEGSILQWLFSILVLPPISYINKDFFFMLLEFEITDVPDDPWKLMSQILDMDSKL